MPDSAIIIDADPLSSSHSPRELAFRERERVRLLEFITNGVNALVTGPTGSGKSSILISAIDEANSRKHVRAVYVDANLYQTTNSILEEVLAAVSPLGSIPQSNSQLIHRLAGRAKRDQIVVCIDHFGHARSTDVVDKLLGLGIGLILIAAARPALDRLSERAKSKIVTWLRIPAYSDEHVCEILLDRAHLALRPGSFSPELVHTLARRCRGNLALGLGLLQASAISAHHNGRSEIIPADIPASIAQDPRLSDDQQALLDILRTNGRLSSAQLYATYRRTMPSPKSPRAFREYMRRLAAMGLVKAAGEKRWRVYEARGE